jgi:uncharacterized membrane protein
MKSTAVLVLVISMLGIQGCYYDKREQLYPAQTVDCSTIKASFKNDIFPLITTRCATANCHSAAAASGGAVYTDYEKIKARADLIRLRAVILRDMPQDSRLSEDQINQLRCWLDSGAPNN